LRGALPLQACDAFFRDKERLAKIVNNPERPMQLIFAGKAHPHDHLGKELIREIVKTAELPEFRHAIVFLEITTWRSPATCAGADVWVNTPRRPKEASGTSGIGSDLQRRAERQHPRRMVGRSL
jgi:starch phosphorylase